MNKLMAIIVCLSMLVSIPVFACTGAGSGGGGSAGGASAGGASAGAAGDSGSSGASAGDSGPGASSDGSGGVGSFNDMGDRKAKYMPDCDSFDNFMAGKCR